MSAKRDKVAERKDWLRFRFALLRRSEAYELLCRGIREGWLEKVYETHEVCGHEVGALWSKAWPIFGDVYADMSDDEDQDFERLWPGIKSRLPEVERPPAVRDYATVFRGHFDGVVLRFQNREGRPPTLDEVRDALASDLEKISFGSVLLVDVFERQQTDLEATIGGHLSMLIKGSQNRDRGLHATRTGLPLRGAWKPSQLKAWRGYLRVLDTFSRRRKRGVKGMEEVASALGRWPIPSAKEDNWQSVARQILDEKRRAVDLIATEEAGLFGTFPF